MAKVRTTKQKGLLEAMSKLAKVRQQLAEAEKRVKELEMLEEELARGDIEDLKQRFQYEYADCDGAIAVDYVAALERCRPWCVIKAEGNIARGIFLGLGGVVMLFESKKAAEAAAKGFAPGWEVVQWDGIIGLDKVSEL